MRCGSHAEQVALARAPVRVDLTGGYVDVAPFAAEEGGRVVNIAVDLQARVGGYDRRTDGARHPLLAAVAETLARGHRDRLQSWCDVPLGTGLGTSGAIGVASVVACWLIERSDLILDNSLRWAAAERAYRLEQSLGLLGGRQDQYAAAFGGANRWTCGADGAERCELTLKPATAAEMRRRWLIAHFGGGRSSGALVGEINGPSTRRRQLDAILRHLNEMADPLAAALQAGDTAALADLLTTVRSCQRALHPAVVDRHIESLLTARGAPVLAAKPLGGGGGGAAWLVIPRADDSVGVVEWLSAHGARCWPVEASRVGVQGVTHCEAGPAE